MLTKILNRLSQIVFTTAHADPAAAPVEPYPDYPHIAARRAARRAPIEDLVQQLIPGGGE
ncbi:hypothetical protein IU436_25410 [Nocardia farcinica]|uniref:hypothetical protein n=1 Tax=Nocardia farcinica TaxID=37329 RepID=UPI001895F5E6|nr:hypothetical protein [Nocardia farcinica]MBF6315050.1 hypothetical protein [Nocardia farcinica]MBF6422031.1 hypothetical protein [Nocardia farcinica]MBF6433688.1 hypothetical protein [Nocardia farcinica]MBF6504694.1 hypothetical protein [Nocardia farcinica]MBF6573729.1 hypothetical protein [Nocardia farcinica]